MRDDLPVSVFDFAVFFAVVALAFGVLIVGALA